MGLHLEGVLPLLQDNSHSVKHSQIDYEERNQYPISLFLFFDLMLVHPMHWICLEVTARNPAEKGSTSRKDQKQDREWWKMYLQEEIYNITSAAMNKDLKMIPALP